MKVSLEWLREWVEIGDDVAALAAQLTMAGFEVEGRSLAAGPFSGVVVGEVTGVARHPQADKLSVCTVNAGEAAPLTIVCGASNVRAGMKVPLARVGAKLPGDVAIKRAKLRGVESEGMLCSARELELGEGAEGILELPREFPTGADLRAVLGLDDTVFEINFTPNRGDALSVLGLAREIAVLRGVALRGPALAPVPAKSAERLPVRLLAPEGCARFAGRVIRGVNPRAATPLWMRERLRRAGLRSLGPLVDVTNYVMLELGQPMHAYDLRELNLRLDARLATTGERLELLDGSEIPLTPDMLVIADAAAPVGLAGIMGGKKSGIAPDTTDVFLEAAWFAPDAIAGRGRRFGVITDASQRFERGVDPAGQERAIERASSLLIGIAGGTPGPTEVVTDARHLPKRAPIALRPAALKRLIGIDVPAKRVEAILSSLGLVVAAAGEGWSVTPPSYRFDLAQEADLVEEVARIYGYNEIPEIDAPMPQRPGAVPERDVRPRRFALSLVERGYYEAINYTFVDPALQRRLFPDAPTLKLKNPISAELAEMRVSLWPGLIKALIDNANRQQSRVRLFEHGAKFVLEGTDLKEVDTLAAVAWGAALPEQWGVAKGAGDFYDVKADVEALVALSGEAGTFRFSAETLSCLHPGRSARIYRGARACGWLGELHPEIARALEISPAPFLFELELDITRPAALPHAEELSRFPAVRRDLAVVVHETATFSQLRESVTVAASSLLRELKVFDVYRGQGIETGRKSVALGLILQDKSTTLTDADVDAVMTAVREQLSRDLKATFRD
ncbi:MAG TPA: phenylalanine--tRNA ligase subunit beta [Steroidobacteraceae bacterium]|nr:phenylalanine--tRNA ligase subunit beta [Steroidobacteraceae bacterium]